VKLFFNLFYFFSLFFLFKIFIFYLVNFISHVCLETMKFIFGLWLCGFTNAIKELSTVHCVIK
jgi:hypothetical protein